MNIEIGQIFPCRDIYMMMEEEYKNLKDTIELVDELISEIHIVAGVEYCEPASLKKSGKLAADYLKMLKKDLNNDD